jgi:hypothetical protein
MTKREYTERLEMAGAEARAVHGHLEDLLLELPDVERTYGSGSMKLYGFGGSSLLFQSAPAKKAAGAGLIVQLREGWVAEDRASDIRQRVASVGGVTHTTFNIIPTKIAAASWVRVKDHVLVPFLREGR